MRTAASAKSRGLRAIIAGAGGAAHLPGMLAAKTAVPVLGVPVQSKALNGMDSLLSIVQMPALGWEASAWIGGDIQRLWLRSEGEAVDGRIEHGDIEVLYGRSVRAWWDVVAGVRHARDTVPQPPAWSAGSGSLRWRMRMTASATCEARGVPSMPIAASSSRMPA